MAIENEQYDLIMMDTMERTEKTLSVLKSDYAVIRAGRANPNVLDPVMVSYYGVDTPLKQLATISVPEARQLLIKPFDRSCLHAIEKGIFEANIGLTPNNDGESIRIVIPPLTEERRIELTKQVKAISEEGKVAIRNIRRDSIESLEKENLPEDVEKSKTNEIQNLVNEYNKKIEAKLKEKEQDLLTV